MLKRTRRLLCALGIAVFALSAPGAALGFDGEVGDAGDTTSSTDVFVSGDQATFDTQYVRDCPTYIADCWIEVRFVSKCPETWCGWTYQNWRQVNSSGTAQADCLGSGNEDNTWRVEYRVGFSATAPKTVEFWGENEGYFNLSGSFVYRLVAEVLFNVTNATGTRYGTKISTVTTTFGYSPTVEVATSAGQVLYTC